MPLAHAPSVGLEPIRLDQVRCSHDDGQCACLHFVSPKSPQSTPFHAQPKAHHIMICLRGASRMHVCLSLVESTGATTSGLCIACQAGTYQTGSGRQQRSRADFWKSVCVVCGSILQSVPCSFVQLSHVCCDLSLLVETISQSCMRHT